MTLVVVIRKKYCTDVQYYTEKMSMNAEDKEHWDNEVLGARAKIYAQANPNPFVRYGP